MGLRAEQEALMMDFETIGETRSRAWGNPQSKALDPLMRNIVFNWALGAPFADRVGDCEILFL
jgi:hypothetical protein